jgi:hypothetical protein
VEASQSSERRYRALSLEARTQLKAAVNSSGRSNNYQKLNAVPTRIVQSVDLESDRTKHSLTIDVEMLFNGSVRITSTTNVNFGLY